MIKGKELRQGMGLPSPAFPVDSPLLPAARLSKPFLLPGATLGAILEKKPCPIPSLTCGCRCWGGFSFPLHHSQPCVEPAVAAGAVKPLFGSVTLILRYPWSGSKAKFYVI